MPEYSSLQKDYAKYRIQRAKEDLEAAHLLRNAVLAPDLVMVLPQKLVY